MNDSTEVAIASASDRKENSNLDECSDIAETEESQDSSDNQKRAIIAMNIFAIGSVVQSVGFKIVTSEGVSVSFI